MAFKKRTFRKIKKRTFKKRVKKPLKRTIKQVIRRMAEKKSKTAGINNIGVGVALTVPTTVINCLPIIDQGVGAGGREGNEIELSRSVCKVMFSQADYNAVSNYEAGPYILKAWLVTGKTIQNGVVPIGADYGNFFQDGNGTLGFQGNSLDLMLAVNKDRYTVHKTFTRKVSYANGQAADAEVVRTVTYHNNDFKASVSISFDISKYVKKIKYNDTTNVCTNKNLALIMCVVPADLETVSSGQFPLKYSAIIEFTYTDL
jgi:hypothetical protein